MGALFTKPFFPNPRASLRYPYPAAAWRDRDAFEVYLLDGGAFFFSNAFLGRGTGAAYLAAWDDGSLFAPWMDGARIEWDRFWHPEGSLPYQRPFEQHVWINRLYFLLPLAQAYARTGLARYARAWDSLFRDWVSAHPYHEPHRPGDESRFVWFDMQVTTRLLVLIHSAYLLSAGGALSVAAWKRLYSAIRQHAQFVHTEAAHDLSLTAGRGNHYQQKGTALIYAGVLFPEWPEAEAWRTTGMGVLRDHAAREICSDGASVEASPSYSHFIARLCLDPHVLLTENGYAPIPGWEACVRRQYAYLSRTCAPDGRTLQISDSYSMDAQADIAFVRSIHPMPATSRGGSRWFGDLGLGVLRQGRFDITVDAMPVGLWHHHAGKPNVLVYVDGAPLLVDTGCPNYDDDLRERWCKTAAAHNTVVVRPLDGATPCNEQTAAPVCRCRCRGATFFEIEHVCEGGAFSYVWTRRVQLDSAGCRIIDVITSPKPVCARLCLHLAPCNVGLVSAGQAAVASRPGGDVCLMLAGRQVFERDDRMAQGPDNHWQPSPGLSVIGQGRRVTFDLRIAPVVTKRA